MIARDFLKIGTRGSPLALAQSRMVQAALARHWPDLSIEIITIKTSGDWTPEDGETRLEEAAGGKGQFAKEIENALLAGEIDIAVHSMKDMDSRLPMGLAIDHMLPREDPRDCIIMRGIAKNNQNNKPEVTGDAALPFLPENALVGTASVRREAFLKALRPDLKFTVLRGNVETRLQKLADGQADATFLALAGLRRLEMQGKADYILEPDLFLPAAAQGAVGIERRVQDEDIKDLLDPVSCPQTVLCVQAERQVLKELDGSCHTPIAAHAILDNGTLSLRAAVAARDGTRIYKDEIGGPARNVREAVSRGRRLGRELRFRIHPSVLK